MVLQPLDLQTIFVNYFAGSLEIAFFIALAFFSYLGAKFRMPNVIFGCLIVLFVSFFAKWYPVLYVVMIIPIAFIVYSIISRIFKE